MANSAASESFDQGKQSLRKRRWERATSTPCIPPSGSMQPPMHMSYNANLLVDARFVKVLCVFRAFSLMICCPALRMELEARQLTARLPPRRAQPRVYA
jgi:hypothetical protein